MAKRKGKMQVQIDEENAKRIEAEKKRTGATHARIVNRRISDSYQRDKPAEGIDNADSTQ